MGSGSGKRDPHRVRNDINSKSETAVFGGLALAVALCELTVI